MSDEPELREAVRRALMHAYRTASKEDLDRIREYRRNPPPDGPDKVFLMTLGCTREEFERDWDNARGGSDD